MGRGFVKIELCEEGRLKITLQKEDMSRMEMSYEELDYSNMQTRKMIWEILDEANRKTGFDTSGGKLLIEAVPLSDGGCILYFTVLSQSAQPESRRTRLKRLSGPYLYRFQGTEAMLSAIENLWKAKGKAILASDLYRLDRDYYLVLYTDQKNCEEFSPVLSEYGRAAGSGNSTAAYVAEHGEVIASENAVQRIACCLTV